MDPDGFFEALGGEDATHAVLDFFEDVDHLLAGHVEADHLIVEGEHGEEVLVLDVSRKPSRAQTGHIDEGDFCLRAGAAHEICH